MTTDELLKAMKRGAVVFVNESTGETKIVAHGGLPPMRECIRISRKSTQMFAGRASYIPTTPDELAFQEEERQHYATCPSCMSLRPTHASGTPRGGAKKRTMTLPVPGWNAPHAGAVRSGA
jgi:hypothetical protein